MLIDFHTHAFPDGIYKRTIEILENNIKIHSGTELKAVGSGNIDGLVEDMKANGIDISVVMPIATVPKQTDNIISFAEKVNNTVEGVYSFASVHPLGENVEATLDIIKEKGFIGIKLHPDYQDFYIDSKESLRVLRKCEELGLMVILHTGHDHGCAPPRHCEPKRLSNLLGELSCDNIIAAHMGGWKMWEEAQKYIINTPFWIDTSFSLHILDKKTASDMIKAHGADKVLFGSDWPWYSPVETYNMVMELDISDEERSMIFYRNAKKLLGI